MDELERLRQAHGSISPPEPDAVDVARRKLKATMGSARPGPATVRPRSRWRRVTLTALAAGGTALAIILVVGDVFTPTGPSSALAARVCLQDTSSSAGPCLAALGELAAPDDALAAGDVYYRRDLWSQSVMYFGPDGGPRLQARGTGVFAIVRAGARELWVAGERSGRIQYGPPNRPYLPSTADVSAWRAAGGPDLDRIAGRADARDRPPAQQFGPEKLDELLLGHSLNEALPGRDPLRALPTDPEALSRALRGVAWFQRVRVSGDDPCARDLSDCSAGTRRNIDSVYASDITALLRYPFTSPDLRRSLMRVLGDMPGTRRIGALDDPLGRRGVGIQLPDGVDDGRNIVVFDLTTGRLLADGRAEDGTSATLRWGDVYDLEVARVDSIGVRPES